jgi:hypothetical protein
LEQLGFNIPAKQNAASGSYMNCLSISAVRAASGLLTGTKRRHGNAKRQNELRVLYLKEVRLGYARSSALRAVTLEIIILVIVDFVAYLTEGFGEIVAGVLGSGPRGTHDHIFSMTER